MEESSACSCVVVALSLRFVCAKTWAALGPPILLPVGRYAALELCNNKGNAAAPDVIEALCAAVLVPVLCGIQRQFSQDLAGLPDFVLLRRRRRGSLDHAGERHFHRALFLSVGARRRTRRPPRQGAGGAMAKIL